jgi:hypothetical protein
MPHIADQILQQLGLNLEEERKLGWDGALKWGGLKAGQRLGEPSILFPQLQ